MYGYDLIRAERIRQVVSEDYSAAHDKGHEDELALAAACYALVNVSGGTHLETLSNGVPWLWPWESGHWKPRDKKRDLVRAGALIAAALDAILAAEPPTPASTTEGIPR